MKDSVGPVIVFDRDGEGMAFRHLEDAAASMEAVDVLDGEYEAAFTISGQVVAISADRRDGDVTLRVTEQRDPAGLHACLVRAHQRMNLVGDVDDPTQIANELLREEWATRWPRRPAWLRRRLYGDSPPTV